MLLASLPNDIWDQNTSQKPSHSFQISCSVINTWRNNPIGPRHEYVFPAQTNYFFHLNIKFLSHVLQCWHLVVLSHKLLSKNTKVISFDVTVSFNHQRSLIFFLQPLQILCWFIIVLKDFIKKNLDDTYNVELLCLCLQTDAHIY